jgi:hypothetical protein
VTVSSRPVSTRFIMLASAAGNGKPSAAPETINQVPWSLAESDRMADRVCAPKALAASVKSVAMAH